MRGQLKQNLVKLLVPLGFSCFLLAVLLCGLAQVTEAEPGMSSAVKSQEMAHPGRLDYRTGVSICQQTENLVPNPYFERDGKPWADHWYEGGPAICSFTYVNPGYRSEVAAQINASAPRDEVCKLFTPMQEITVTGGRSFDYSAWTQAILSSGDAYLRVTFWDQQGEYLGEAHTTSVADTHGKWVKVTGSVTPTADARYARAEPVLPGPSVGWVRFDDIFLGLATCLEISKRDDPDPVEPGHELTYTIVYSNTGREKATDVEITETYDKYVDFERAQPHPNKGNTVWEFSELLAGASGTITLVVQVEDAARDHVSLVNCVEIDSDETVKHVSTCIPTHMITDGCAIAIFPSEAQKTVEPGDATDYRLTLYNVGSCDGRAYLTATSSQGWDVTIAPSTTYTLPSDGGAEEVTVSPIVPWNTGSVTDVTFITATLACESPCTDTVVATATVTTIVSVESRQVYLPLVLRRWPPPPTLQLIDNPGGVGSYNICWTADWGNLYVLEEAKDSAFTGAVEAYTGGDTCCGITGRGAARYHYRVKALTGSLCSCWSNAKWVDVLWEAEPNDDALTEANGSIVSGLTYLGTFTSTTDAKDYFYFDLPITHSVEIWLTRIPAGNNYDLALRDASLVPPIGQSRSPNNADEHILAPGLLPKRYYVQVYWRSGVGCPQPYHLRVVYQ
jgi:uncharacterized repeat protein (TIGR01451 family)